MLKFKRVFLMLLLMLLLVAAAYAEETTAPAATPEPIRQYSISDVLSRGMYLLDSTDPAATDYVLRIGPKSHELCLSLRPAKEHRIDASAVMTAGEESVVLAVQLSQDAVYIDLDGDAIAVRYADLIDVISSFERLPGFEEEKIMSSSDALASLLEELSQEFVDGAFSIRESGSSFYIQYRSHADPSNALPLRRPPCTGGSADQQSFCLLRASFHSRCFIRL